MTGLDWFIVGLVCLMAVAGAAQGLIVGAATLVGFGLGLLAGGQLGQELVGTGTSSPYAPLFGLGGAIFGGALFAGVLQVAGARVRARLRAPGSTVVDALGGAVLSGALALGLVWLGGAVALQTPGPTTSLREELQRSSILRRLNTTLPPSGPVLNALARFDPFPRIEGPPAEVAPPRAAIARDPQVAAAAEGVVKVTGIACGLSVEGSGWIAARDVVVTNAHVVAGQPATDVQLRGTGPRVQATVIAFDSRNDVAVLRAPGLGGRVLPFGDGRTGASAAILGFPEDGPYDVRAGRLGAEREVQTQDAYGQGPVLRRLVTLRGVVRPGNSGGPMVDGRGRVVTTVFAATRSGPRGGYGVPNALVRRAVQTATGRVSSGRCGS